MSSTDLKKNLDQRILDLISSSLRRMEMTQLNPLCYWQAARLNFRYPFRIAHGQRTGTDVVLLQLRMESYVGFGEATLPPYLGWTAPQVMERLASARIVMDFSGLHPVWQDDQEALHDCPPAKAAVDMAVWTLFAQSKGTSIQQVLNAPERHAPHTFTIGISERSEMQDKIAFGIEHGFDLFKLKMDGTRDDQILSDYLALSNRAFAVDANQGWTTGAKTEAFALSLQAAGCVLIEQPFDKNNHFAHGALKHKLHIPLIADEGIQTLEDLIEHGHHYSGVNIKLQKCGGLTRGLKMLEAAKSRGLKILVGCMSESSIGCGVAEALSPWADWADLDGPWLISNDQEIRDQALHLHRMA
jgi:L-Ala-D/L-Glu epimerase